MITTLVLLLANAIICDFVDYENGTPIGDTGGGKIPVPDTDQTCKSNGGVLSYSISKKDDKYVNCIQIICINQVRIGGNNCTGDSFDASKVGSMFMTSGDIFDRVEFFDRSETLLGSSGTSDGGRVTRRKLFGENEYLIGFKANILTNGKYSGQYVDFIPTFETGEPTGVTECNTDQDCSMLGSDAKCVKESADQKGICGNGPILDIPPVTMEEIADGPPLVSIPLRRRNVDDSYWDHPKRRRGDVHIGNFLARFASDSYKPDPSIIDDYHPIADIKGSEGSLAWIRVVIYVKKVGEHKDIIIAFKGSDSLREFYSDLKFSMIDCKVGGSNPIACGTVSLQLI